MIAPYYVESFDALDADHARTYGPFEVIRAKTPQEQSMPEPAGVTVGNPILSTDCLCNVEEVAATPRFVMGKGRFGFFIVDTGLQHLQLLDTADEFEKARRANGIDDNVSLKNPDGMARSLPNQVIRPWEHRTMAGLFGLSDPAWGDLIQSFGLFLAIASGLALKNARWDRRLVFATLIGTGLGILINYAVNARIIDNGPDAFVGAVALPIEFALAANLAPIAAEAVVALISNYRLRRRVFSCFAFPGSREDPG